MNHEDTVLWIWIIAQFYNVKLVSHCLVLFYSGNEGKRSYSAAGGRKWHQHGRVKGHTV